MELSIPDSVLVVRSETLRLMISATDNQRLRTIVVGSLARPAPNPLCQPVCRPPRHPQGLVSMMLSVERSANTI